MNHELRLLLKHAGYPHADDPDLWSYTVMQHNGGAVPRPEHLGRNFMSRGFHLLLMDSRGTPTHFAKCRSADDTHLERESHVLEILGADPALQRTLPSTRSACSDVMRVLLSKWLRGTTFARLGPTLDAVSWRRAAWAILRKADLVAVRAAELLPDLLQLEGPVRPSESAVGDFAALAAVGVDPQLLETIRAAMAGAPALPRRLQHGDLWSENTMFSDGSWWLLDFEAYGRVQVPLYDVFHLLRSNPRRQGSLTQWLSTRADDELYPWARASHSVLQHFTHGLHLSATAVGGAYLYYLVEFIARMHGEGIPRTFAHPYLEELRLVAGDIEAGLPLEELVPLELTPDQEVSIER